jgi:hypothetical protein
MANGMIRLGVAAIVIIGLAACSPIAPAVTPAPEPPAVLAIDGLYEVTITEDELIAGGVTDPAVLAEQAGTYYWTFDDGTWAYEQQSEQPLEVPGAIGSYAIDGSDYTHYWSDDESVFTTATIAVLPDGSLRFTDIVDGDAAFQEVSEVLFGLHDWVRIGD